jgi:hypothetical protein
MLPDDFWNLDTIKLFTIYPMQTLTLQEAPSFGCIFGYRGTVEVQLKLA